MARPKIKIDEVLLEKLAKLHLSNDVISDCLGISRYTLDRRFATKIGVWRSKTTSKIADVLFDEGINKRQSWAIKLLASRHLGYSEKAPFEIINDESKDKGFVLAYNLADVKKKASE